jgi:hypothetical protein
MDFLRDVKAKLEELEEFSREAQAATQNQGQSALFRPKTQTRAQRQSPTSQPSRQTATRRQQTVGRKPTEQFGPPAGTAKRSRLPVDSAKCGVDEWSSEHVEKQPEQPSGWLFDSLYERLDEAYILQEIMGKPRCLQEWDD